MRFDHKIPENKGEGKYALVNMRRVRALEEHHQESIRSLLRTLDRYGVLDKDAFFPIKMKDKYAAPALMAYAERARLDDPEWANEIMRLVYEATGSSSQEEARLTC